MEADDPDRNAVIASLDGDDHADLLAELDPIPLTTKLVLYEADEPVKYVYFVLQGVVSLVGAGGDRDYVEVATVGNEGIIGIPAFLGGERSVALRAFVQVPGHALRMKVERFRLFVSTHPKVNETILRYTLALITQISQTAVCNRLHPVEERCAKWLLMTHDRVAEPSFPLTQEFLAQMLGVRRGVVNLAARSLQQSGLIKYTRGQITITDRKGLEETSCECYGIVMSEIARLLPNNHMKKGADEESSAD